jgi:hypothetical protein
MGMKTGVDLAKVVEAGTFISCALNRYFSQFSAEDVHGQFQLSFDALLNMPPVPELTLHSKAVMLLFIVRILDLSKRYLCLRE